MGIVRTDGIVLRHVNFGENDRILTILSPTLGLVTVSARGCRKATSRMLSASELFTAGEYLLYEKEGRFTLSSFSLQENFYPLRNDFTRLSHGAYWLALCEATAQPGEDCARLFKMLLLSLAVLTYGELPERPLTAVFLMQFSALAGFEPCLDVCARCGKPLEAPMRYDAEHGGACCAKCAPVGYALAPQVLSWLREAQQKGAFVLAGKRALPEGDEETAERAFRLMRAHVERRVEKVIAAAKFL